MKNIILTYLVFTGFLVFSQNTERKNLPLKTIYQITSEEINTSLDKLELKGNIKSVIEEYKNSSTTDTVIDFSKYSVTNSDVKKEPWSFSPNITKYYKANFNKNGYLVNSISCKFGGNDSVFVRNTYEDDLLSYQVHLEKDYPGDKFNRGWKTEFIYDKNNNLIRVLDNQKVKYTHKYHPKKMQIETISTSYKTDSLQTEIKTYDKYGFLLSNQYYDHNNKKGDLWTYEYDKNGKKIKEKLYTAEGKELEYKARKIDDSIKVYRLYDKNKNCIERVILRKDGSMAIRKLTIEYFK